MMVNEEGTKIATGEHKNVCTTRLLPSCY